MALCADRYADLAKISITAASTRTSGALPLGVVFSAIGTSMTGVTYPFHELDFEWDFGDSVDTFPYGTSRNARNSDTGPVAAHVYESAGTFTPTLTVFAGKMFKKYTLPDITVTAWANDANTVAVNNVGDADFSAAPSNAAHLNTDSFNTAIAALTGTVKRLLFKTGGTWTAATAIDPFIVAGPGYVGSYGSGAKPIITKTANNEFFVLGDAVPTPLTITDWRFTNLAFNGGTSGDQVEGFIAKGLLTQFTFHKVDVYDAYEGFNFGANFLDGHYAVGTIYDQIIVSECTVERMTGNGGAGIYGSCKNFGIIGNYVNNTAGSHNCRVFYTNPGVIAHNTLTTPQSGKHCLKLHAPGFVKANTVLIGQPNQYCYVSANNMTGDGWVFAPGPQSADDANEATEYVDDVIFDGNYVTPISGMNYGTNCCIRQRGTWRNNIYNMTGSGAGGTTGIGVQRRAGSFTASSPDLIWAYNNDMNRIEAGDFVGVELATTCSNIFVINNLSYSSAGSSRVFLSNAGATNVTTSTNSSNVQTSGGTVPWVDSTPTSSGDFAPTGYPIAGGTTTVPVYRDFTGAVRNYGNKALVMDMGALKA